MDHKFKNIDFSKLDLTYINPPVPFVATVGKIPEFNPTAQEHRNDEKRYWEESLDILKSIESNTGNLAVLVDLISRNTDQQDEIIGCLTEIHEIAKSKTKVDADSRYQRVMKRITDITGNVEAVQKLAAYGAVIYNFVVQNSDKMGQLKDILK